ncbi:MAG: transposase [Phycisphaerae bacterium]|nr:transposase [Phycisphaerae bacterium]
MPHYRRRHDGELFFLTLVTQGRMSIFKHSRFRRALSEAMRTTQARHPWETTAVVLLPDHLHMIWRLPTSDKDYSTRITSLKRLFTRAYLAAGGKEASVPAGQRRKRRRGVWQRKFWEHTIRDAKDFRMHLDYIHLNPVKHGYVDRPRDWPWTSFHRHVAQGWYEPDWCGCVDLPHSTDYLWME